MVLRSLFKGISLDRQVIFQLISDRLVENACQHFTEEPRNHEYQYDDKDRGRNKDKETACSDDRDEKAVCTHLLKTLDVLADETVVI